MRTVLLVSLLLFTFGNLHAQKSDLGKRITIHQSSKLIVEDTPSQNPSSYLKENSDRLGLSQYDKMLPVAEIKGASGIVHNKFQQEYKNLPVIGAKYILHSKNDKVVKANGYIAPDIDLDILPKIDLKEVKNAASDLIINTVIVVENYHEKIEVDVHASTLCIIDAAFPKFSGNYRLAYQTFAQANTNLPIHEKVYVDAKNGKIIAHFTEVCDHSVPGKAKTRYYGTQDIIADSISPNQYMLRDSTRGVFTLNGPDRDSSLEYDYPDFYDDDNVWENENNDFDEVAGDAHYCASSFHDFMLDEFDWRGLDNEGLEMVSVVQATRRFYTNAFWNGEAIFLGNGDCDDFGPLTVLDVIGHEFTHGIIDFTCDLVYQDESGALNESLADIFGKSLEYTYDQENFTWLIGHKFRVDQDTDSSFRNMQDPNEERDPKFYLGEFWHTSSSDRGGVHTNSGVLNYWYYMLVEGAEGTNEVGYDYDVESIGMHDALQILFGCMKGYFTESTDYIEAMHLTMQQTEDLYGINSQQYASVVEAWMAVGLYPGIDDFDLSVEEVVEEYFGCMDSEIFIDIIVRNTGTKAYDQGSIINLRYQFDGLMQEVLEDVVLEEDLMPGDSIYHTFAAPIVYEENIQDDVTITVDNVDNLMINNSYKADLEFSPNDGSDLDLTEFEFRIDDPCNPMLVDSYRIGYTNDGCEQITDDDNVMLIITTDLQQMTIPYTLSNAIDPGNITISFRNLPEQIDPGFSTFQVELVFDRDADLSNNIIEGSFVIPEGIEEGYLEEFDAPEYREKLNINTSSFAGSDSVVVFNETEMFAITSKRTASSFEDCMDVEDFFNENRTISTISACLDAIGMEEPVFGMDITQIRNGVGATLNEEFRTIIKVSNDSLSYPLIYNQENEKTEYHEFPLPVGFIGTFEIEVFAYAGDSDAFTEVGLDQLDAVLFDKLELFDKADRPEQDPEPEIPANEEYLVYPTLVDGDMQVFAPDQDVLYQFLIFDILGRLIVKEEMMGDEVLNLSSIPSGTYFYQIKENNRVIQSSKFVRIN